MGLTWSQSLIAVTVMMCTVACDSKSSTPPAPAAGTPTPGSAHATPSGSARATAKKSSFPPEARRDSPPKAVAKTALEVGASAPALLKIASTSGDWSRGEKVTVLVFYRGHW